MKTDHIEVYCGVGGWLGLLKRKKKNQPCLVSHHAAWRKKKLEMKDCRWRQGRVGQQGRTLAVGKSTRIHLLNRGSCNCSTLSTSPELGSVKKNKMKNFGPFTERKAKKMTAEGWVFWFYLGKKHERQGFKDCRAKRGIALNYFQRRTLLGAPRKDDVRKREVRVRKVHYVTNPLNQAYKSSVSKRGQAVK